MKEKNLNWLYFFQFCFLLWGDLFSKHLIRLTGGFYVCNFGIAWGIKLNNVLLWLVLATFSFLLFFYFFKTFKSRDVLITQALLLLLTGTMGNLIDRALFGCVTDFFKLPLLTFPFFNLADIFITLGATLLIIHSIYLSNRA